MLSEKKDRKNKWKSDSYKIENLAADCSSDTFVLFYVHVWMKMKTKRKHATGRLQTIYLQDTAKLQLKVLELSDFSRGDF